MTATQCGRCRSERVVSGRMVYDTSEFRRVSFVPDQLKFFSMVFRGVPTQALACVECGFVWAELPADQLQDFLRQNVKPEVLDRMAIKRV